MQGGGAASGGDALPSQTLYVNNLNDKLKKNALKRDLYALFNQYGPILDIVALKTAKMRGQAFVVYADLASAANALRSTQGMVFHGKPMRVQYGRSKSDAAAKADGTYAPRKRKATSASAAKRTAAAASSAPAPQQQPQVAELVPNRILFVQNLPEQANAAMLQMLFQQFEGFVEVRMIPGKIGIAFVEYQNEGQAAVAMNGLNNFKIHGDSVMRVSYAKK